MVGRLLLHNVPTFNGRPSADHAFILPRPFRRAGPFQRLVIRLSNVAT
jgi:hypothetical protein